MSDENKTDETKDESTVDFSTLGPTLFDVDLDMDMDSAEFREKMHKDIEAQKAKTAQEADPNFWASMTPAEILAYMNISQEAFARVFPTDYEVLLKPLSELTKEEREQRIADTRARLKNIKKATNPDKIPMPNQQAITEKYVKEQEERERDMPLTMQALISHFANKEDGPIKLTPEMLADALSRAGGDTSVANMVASAIQEIHRRYLQAQQSKAKQTKRLMTDLLSFDAKKARQLWLDNIKRDSNLHNILGTIHESANRGHSETIINYVSTYDQLKLGELGFELERTGTNGRAGEYTVSWSA